VLLTVALTTMLAPLNSTMIVVALPRITSAFHTNLTATGWLVTGYLVVMASVQPIAGKLGDRFGRRLFILGGLIYFGAASLGAATASSLPWLVFFRVQQALAGALALPNGIAWVREVVPAQRRASRFGLIGALISLAAAGGPPLGGLLIRWGGWHAIFLVNFVFIVPALLLGWVVFAQKTPKVRPVGPAFDWLGAVLLASILLGAAWTTVRSGQLTPPVVAGAVLVALFVLFILWEYNHPDPVLQVRFFKSLGFTAATGGVCLSNFAMYTTFLVVPLLLTTRFAWDEAKIGLVLTALFGSNIAIAPLGGRLADRFGRRWPTMAGLLLLTLGLVPLAVYGWHVPVWLLLLSLVISGVGLGLSSAGLQTSAVEAVDSQHAGVASGVFSTSRYLGSIVGSSLLGGLLGAQRDQLDNLNILFLLSAVAALLATLLSFKLRDFPDSFKRV